MPAAAVTTIQHVPDAPRSAPTGPSLVHLCAAASALIEPFRTGEKRYDPSIEGGFAGLAQIVDTIEKTFVPGRVQSYIPAEMLERIKGIQQTAMKARSDASRAIRSAKNEIAALGVAGPVADFAEGLVDREIRDVVRGLTAAKRDALLDEMRSGSQVRAMLASARHPMPTDFDVEAASLYSRFSEPGKRSTFLSSIAVHEEMNVAAQALLDAADATRAIVDRFTEIEDSHKTSATAAVRSSVSITMPGGSQPISASNAMSAAPALSSRPSVQIEGNSIVTRVP